jgi:hypothetical protein
MSEEQVAEVVADATVAQSVASDWRTSVPEEIRGHKSLEHITDVGALAKSYVNAQSMIGADKLAIPGKHATDEDWGEVYRRLGRPDAPDGYELDNEMPEGIEQSDDMLSWFKGAAHEAGLTPSQAQKLLGGYNQFLGTQVGAGEGQIQQMRETAEVELKKEYGAAYADRINNGNAAMQEFGSAELSEIQLADGRLLGDHPGIIKMMVNVSEFINSKIGEDVLAGNKSSGGLTPDDAKAKLSEIRAPGSPYWDQRHPEHQFFVQEGLRYQEMLNVGA